MSATELVRYYEERKANGEWLSGRELREYDGARYATQSQTNNP